MTHDSAYLQSLADLHLCLARAFLPPLTAEFAATVRTDLPDDLDAITDELSFPCAEPVALLRAGLDATDEQRLLQTYSALFLQPPIRTHLNASVHLDGTLLGPSSKSIEEAYRRHGLQPADTLHDLSDHISRLLEFIGLLFARAAEAAASAGEAERATILAAEAREFSAAFLRPWLPGLAVEIRGICAELDLPTPYQHLAELAAIAAWEGDAWRHAGDRGDKHDRPERAPRQTLCSTCGQAFAEDAALIAVRRIMENRGLDITHLDRCPGCRGLADQGPMETLSAPESAFAAAR